MRIVNRFGMVFSLLLLACSAVRAQGDAAAQNDPKQKADRSKLIYIGADGQQKVVEGAGTIVNRGYLGIELTELTPELRAHFGAPESAGVMVARVVPGSPADKAGLKVGDIITALDGKPVESSWDVRARVRPLEAGAALPLEVRRDGGVQTFTATVEQRHRREVDYAPFLMKNGDADRIMAFDGPEGPLPPRMRLHPSSAREEMLEKKLKALEKRLNELESRIPKN